MIKEFKAFAMRGSLLDLAIGIVIGTAFGKIITSFVNDVLMPPIGLLFGRANFSSLFINLSGERFPSLAAAKEAGAPTINYGLFFNAILDFVIVAFVLFLVIRQINRWQRPAAPTTKDCPYCFTAIALEASRCPNCTSQLQGA